MDITFVAIISPKGVSLQKILRFHDGVKKNH